MLLFPYRAVVLKLRGRPSHLRRWLLTFLSIRSVMKIVSSYTSRGHRICGRMPCWYIQHLNFPGKPDLSTFLSYVSSPLMDDWIVAVSQRLWSKSFLRLFTGFSLMVGIGVSSNMKWNLSMTLLFFRKSDLDLAGLEIILAHLMSLSRT